MRRANNSNVLAYVNSLSTRQIRSAVADRIPGIVPSQALGPLSGYGRSGSAVERAMALKRSLKVPCGCARRVMSGPNR